jgi:hypothetical protein
VFDSERTEVTRSRMSLPVAPLLALVELLPVADPPLPVPLVPAALPAPLAEPRSLAEPLLPADAIIVPVTST